MSGFAAGAMVEYEVTWLEMTSRPRREARSLPDGEAAQLIECRSPPEWYFFSLYDAVGRDYAWDDMHEAEPSDTAELIESPGASLTAMIRSGWPQGFFLLDERMPDVSDIAYFGLVENAQGRGLGAWLLDAAIRRCWSRQDVRKVTVNTCTLDHPGAKPLYEKAGFAPVRKERRRRVLKRDFECRQPGKVIQC